MSSCLDLPMPICPVLCSSGVQTQDFVHARSALPIKLHSWLQECFLKRCFRFTGKSSKEHIEFVSAPCLCVHLPRVKIPHQSDTRVSAAKPACTYHCQHCTAHSRGWDSPLLCILSYGFGPVCNMQGGLRDSIIQSSLLALKILCAGWRDGLVV